MTNKGVLCSAGQNTHPLASSAEEVFREVVMKGDPGVLPGLESRVPECQEPCSPTTHTHTDGRKVLEG